MVAKRIIPCLDVKNNQVVKGIQFSDHQIVGDILELAQSYCEQGADELVFYDITASSEQRLVAPNWVSQVAEHLDIPFCVAGGIRTAQQAEAILHAGADKISINSPALENPSLINELVKLFGQQCIVIGIDSMQQHNDYVVYQYTGSEKTSKPSGRKTVDWVSEVQDRGAGEIVLNCMNQDGVRKGYDIDQLSIIRKICGIPLIASGGAGNISHFVDVFKMAQVDGALAASVFHKHILTIPDLKQQLAAQDIEVRL